MFLGACCLLADGPTRMCPCCRFVIAGGVACNRSVRSSFAELAEDMGLELTIPDPHFCTDNGAMVAWAGLERSVPLRSPTNCSLKVF